MQVNSLFLDLAFNEVFKNWICGMPISSVGKAGIPCAEALSLLQQPRV